MAHVGPHTADLEFVPKDTSEEDALLCRAIGPRTVTKICQRIKAMILKLIPIEVEEDSLRSPTSGIITSDVIDAFSKVGGDFQDCVPFALLECMRWFWWDAQTNPSDYDENMCRRVACEVLARKVVAKIPVERQHIILSTRFATIESDGDESLWISAIELAADQSCTFFLSSGESQRTVFALWKGHLVQTMDTNGRVVYKLWDNAAKGGFLDHFSEHRIAVPRYQNIFRIFLWIIFLIAYTVAIQTPERGFGLEDIVLYTQLLGYFIEEVTRIIKIWSWRALGFWTFVNLSIYVLLTVALSYRLADLWTEDPDKTQRYRRLSFQILSSAAPLIWVKLLTIFDLFTYFGSMQIVLARMMREAGIFFALLVVIAVGFAQAFSGIDVADSTRDQTLPILNSLLQGLLGSPDFEYFGEKNSGYPFSLILFYSWNLLTTLILLNILIALFGTAYSQVTDETIPSFMAFFATKTISAVRAPDQYVYPAPFNLVEILILPLEFIVSSETYAEINKWLMRTMFFIPLSMIALFESRHDAPIIRRQKLKTILDEYEEELEENPAVPEEEREEQEGMKIVTVSYEELTKKFPDVKMTVTMNILNEVIHVKNEVNSMKMAKM